VAANVDGGLGAVAESVASAGNDVAAIGGGVAEDGGLGALTYSVGDVVEDGALGVVAEVGAPLTTTVESVAAPVSDAVAAAGTPLTTTVESFVTPFSETVAAAGAPFVVDVPVPPPTASGGATAGGGEDTSGPAGGDAAADGPAVPANHALVDGAAATATPAAAAHGSAALTDPGGSVLASPVGLPGVADPSAPFDAAPPPFGLVGAADGSAAATADPVPAVPDLGLPAAPVGPSVPDAATMEPLSPVDSALAAIAEVAPDARVLVSAALLAFAGAALIGPRVGGSGADLSMAFTNVRLLPCVIKANLERYVSMLAEAVAAQGPAAAAGGSQVSALAESARSAGRAKAHEAATLPDRVLGVFDSAVGSLRDGFQQTIRDAPEEIEDGLSDSRLMVQIGALLGFVYLGFLTVWFWATRRRPSAPDLRPR
jgi:hypothetical protein